jgi:gliding motility-associated-like protein
VSFSNQSANSVRSNWDFGDGQTSLLNQPSHRFPGINTFTVCLSAINSLNCKTSVCQEIYVGLSRVVAIPAAFSPNSDGHNDDLKVRGGPFIKMELRIYNQWGNLVFLSEHQEEAWDGKHQGEPQAVGPYEYFFTGRTYDDQILNLYGVVNLIR